MAAAISYREIPKEERKRLWAEAYQKNKTKIRALYFASVFVPLLVSRRIAGALLPKSSHLDQTMVGALVAAGLAAMLCVAAIFGVICPLIRREIVRAKNV